MIYAILILVLVVGFPGLAGIVTGFVYDIAVNVLRVFAF
jgi:hypothetical protein